MWAENCLKLYFQLFCISSMTSKCHSGSCKLNNQWCYTSVTNFWIKPFSETVPGVDILEVTGCEGGNCLWERLMLWH